MKIKRWLSLLLACVMVVGMLAGCGTDSPADTGSSNNPSDTGNSGNAGSDVLNAQDTTQQLVGNKDVTIVDVCKTEAEFESAQRSVLNCGMANDCLDFDPFTYNTGNDHMSSLYQSLGVMSNGEVYGVIMKDYSMSDDGLEMYVEIYDYITDSDGNNITASDVKFSYEMSNEYAHLGMAALVEEFEVTGDYTFTFHFSKKMGVGKMDKLMMFHIVSEKAYSEHNMHDDPVGTGAYVLKEHVSGYCTTMVKREDYWQTPELNSSREAANVDEINYYVIAEEAQRTIALKNGTIEYCNNVATEDLEYFEKSDDFNVGAIAADTSIVMYPNCDPSHITSDVNLRNALFYAVDAEAILQSVFGGRGTTQHSKAPAWAVGYNNEWDSEDNYYVANVEKAKEYLDKSSYAGETLVILCNTESQFTDTAQLIIAMLDQVGIKAELNAVDGTIVKSMYADVTAWDIYLTATATNTYWIDSINGAFTTDKTAWDGSENFWYEQELQDMLLLCMDPENATTENFNVLHDYVIENALCKGLVNPMMYYVVPKELTGLSVNRWKYLVAGGCVYEG